MKKKIPLGFTLIELLVVISILGLLAAVIMVSTNSVRSKARDSRRVADLNQVRKALELYYAKYNQYPNYTLTTEDRNWSDMLLALQAEGILASVNATDPVNRDHPFIKRAFAQSGYGYSLKTNPQDPSYPARSYGYMVSSDRSNYRVRAKLENTNSVSLNGSLSGAFLVNGQTTGSNACDKSLGHYCIGNPDNFVPGSAP